MNGYLEVQVANSGYLEVHLWQEGVLGDGGNPWVSGGVGDGLLVSGGTGH